MTYTHSYTCAKCGKGRVDLPYAAYAAGILCAGCMIGDAGDTPKEVAAMRTQCNNCGWELSDRNIEEALLNAGESLNGMNWKDILDHYSFCCPSYTDESGCQGYGRTDADQPACWAYR